MHIKIGGKVDIEKKNATRKEVLDNVHKEKCLAQIERARRAVPDAFAKGGGDLLKKAVADKVKRREDSHKDITQGVKDICHDLDLKNKGVVMFIPSERYRSNYEAVFGHA